MNLKSPLLLLEDDAHLNGFIARSLRKEFTVDQATNLDLAAYQIQEHPKPYEVILADRDLPDGDALDLLPLIQSESPATRICFYSHRQTHRDIQRALEQGADAYLPKPAEPSFLRAHAQALLRRGKVRWQDTLHFRDLHIAPGLRVVTRNQQQVRLSRRECEFLTLLVQSFEGLATLEELMQVFWRQGGEYGESSIHVTIQRLRAKLKPLNIHITSIYGLGYQLEV